MLDLNVRAVLIRLHSRHDQRLVSWLTQESIDEHRGAGEVVHSPRLSFISTEPVRKQEVLSVKSDISEKK